MRERERDSAKTCLFRSLFDHLPIEVDGVLAFSGEPRGAHAIPRAHVYVGVRLHPDIVYVEAEAGLVPRADEHQNGVVLALHGVGKEEVRPGQRRQLEPEKWGMELGHCELFYPNPKDVILRISNVLFIQLYIHFIILQPFFFSSSVSFYRLIFK